MWKDNVYHSNKGFDYIFFKDTFNVEPYLLLLNKHNRSTFIKYRTTNRKLPVEVGRWENSPKIDRISPLCNDDVVGDEYHYLFRCMFYPKSKMQIYTEVLLYKTQHY